MSTTTLLLALLPFSLSGGCNFAKLNAGDTCTDTWSNLVKVLHPSQQGVGYGWIARKLGKDFTDKSTAQKTMDSNGNTPLVIGPNNVPYIIDDHHTLSALQYSGYSSTTITCQVVCNWANFSGTMADFYTKMREKNFFLGIGRPSGDVNSLPALIDPTTIGSTIGTLPDDPWRSLAGYARKIADSSCPKSSKNCLRAFDRECNPLTGTATSFFEFRWAYFMNAAYLDTSLWDNNADASTFKTLYQAIKQPSAGPSKEDATKWQEAADSLRALCRGSRAGKWQLPASLGTPFADSYLPGYVAGANTKIDHDDPDCALPTCPALYDTVTMPMTANATMYGNANATATTV